jgi:oxygen-independent coproporphyrinogen-3 oxidase
MLDEELVVKYDVPTPRYTSYPTIPYWQKEPISAENWKTRLKASYSKNPRLSLYIHLPYCEMLCTYCGCNKRITKNHAVEKPYLSTLLKEWQLYRKVFSSPPILQELHLGGGTPTFFSPENLVEFLKQLRSEIILPPDADLSFEAHPSSTSTAHIELLGRMGFNRISLGIQDFATDILAGINRFQTLEQIEFITRTARINHYKSINYDLIYGLPRQTTEHIRNNMAQIEKLRPDRIAFYSYAHVPWVKPGQRAYSEKDLPTGPDKQRLFELGKTLLAKLGYLRIGMDHFALETDDLSQAFSSGNLHRNFMGYTPKDTKILLGLGVSSISSNENTYVQNFRDLETYRTEVEEERLPLEKGHLLDAADLEISRQIKNILCQFETTWGNSFLDFKDADLMKHELCSLEKDGLIKLKQNGLVVTETGKSYLRNICLVFDHRFRAAKPLNPLFSKSI